MKDVLSWANGNKDILLSAFLAFICLFFLSGCEPARNVGDWILGVEEVEVPVTETVGAVDENGNPVIDQATGKQVMVEKEVINKETGKPVTVKVPKETEGRPPLVLLASLFGFGSIAEALAFMYRKSRVRGVDKTLEGLVAGIEEMVRTGKYNKKHMYDILEKAQDLYGDKDVAEPLIAHIKALYRAKKHPPLDIKPAA